MDALNTGFYQELVRRFEKVSEQRKLVMKKVKRRVVERATISILEDMERMTQQERQVYLEARRDLMEQVLTRDPDYIDFDKRVDIDRVIEEQRMLTRAMHRRDEIWFGHFRD